MHDNTITLVHVSARCFVYRVIINFKETTTPTTTVLNRLKTGASLKSGIGVADSFHSLAVPRMELVIGNCACRVHAYPFFLTYFYVALYNRSFFSVSRTLTVRLRLAVPHTLPQWSILFSALLFLSNTRRHPTLLARLFCRLLHSAYLPTFF